MSKQAGTTKNISTTNPWPAQQPMLNMLLDEAKGRFQSGGPYYAPAGGLDSRSAESFVAPLSDAENQARNWAQEYSARVAMPMAENAQQSVERITRGDYLDPNANPYVQEMIRRSTTGVADQLKEEVFPAIRSGAQLAGQFGGSRQGIAEGLAMDKAQKNAMRTAAEINLGSYGQGLQTLEQGLALSPQIQQMGQFPVQLLGAVGGQERAHEQALRDAAAAKWQYEQNLPYVKLNEFANIVRSPMGGQSTTETQYPQTSGAQQIIGGGLSLVQLIGALRSLGVF